MRPFHFDKLTIVSCEDMNNVTSMIPYVHNNKMSGKLTRIMYWGLYHNMMCSIPPIDTSLTDCDIVLFCIFLYPFQYAFIPSQLNHHVKAGSIERYYMKRSTRESKLQSIDNTSEQSCALHANVMYMDSSLT